MSREFRAAFASVFSLFFLTIIVIVWSIDLRSPAPILIEALLIEGTVKLALPSRSRSAKHRTTVTRKAEAVEQD